MGNSNSGCTPKPAAMHGGAKNLYNLMRAEPHYTEQNTIKFSRHDLANTLSDTSILDVIHKGGKKTSRRERYKEYETQQIKNRNQNFFGGAVSDSINIDFTSDHKYSTVSEGELSALRNLIKQNGGGCGCGDEKVIKGGNVMTGGCGCGENTVLKGGFLNIGSATSSASVYGNIADLSATSDINNTMNRGSATSSANFSAFGNPNNLSATSDINNTMNGGSATSSANFSAFGNPNNLSATSNVNYTANNNGLSATSTLSALSATSALSGGSPQLDSAMGRLQKLANIQFGGFNNGNSTSDLISAFSNSDLSSFSGAVNYSNIIGGGWDNKMSRTEETEKTSSSSSTKTESSTTITGGDSEMSRINKLKSVSTSSTRSKKASSTSSDGSSITSTVTGSSDSSSVTGSSIDSSSSSSTLYSANSGSMANKVYLTSTMSGGEFIDAKQFYSSENGDLYSSDTNYLRHNLTKRRFR